MKRALFSSVASSLALVTVIACSSRAITAVEDPEDQRDAGADSSSAPEAGSGVLAMSPEVAHSGFDGVHSFQVPLAVDDATEDLTVTADDTAAVTITPAELLTKVKDDGSFDTAKHFLVDVKKAGAITLTASSNGRTATTTLTVTSYDPSRWTTGQMRYNNPSGMEPACTMCHAGATGIDHTPSALAAFDDQAVATVITTGVATSGFPISGVTGGHRWMVTQEQLDGLVPYLRGLTPRGFR